MFFRITIVLIAVLVMIPQTLSAAGVFSISSAPNSAVATGHTELLGSITLVLNSGTTGADTLVIDVSPFKITNAAATDIRVTATGNLAVGPGIVSIDTDKSLVLVPINVNATSGAVRIESIRVSLVDTGASSVSARVRWQASGNILSTASTLLVIDQVQTGLAADPITDRFVVYNSTVYDGDSAISLREGFASAFNNSTGFGQTNPTEVRVRVTDFPAGLRLNFPATVPATETAATLTTLQGGGVILRSGGPTEVIYKFNKVTASDTTIESFTIPFTVAVEGAVEDLQPTFDLTLYPVGAAVPGGALPSTSIPRYAESNIVVLAGTSKIITKNLYWTGISASRENSLFLSNPGTRVTNVTLTAYSASGQSVSGAGITNPAQLSLSTNQSSERTLTSWFGSGATTVASVRVQSTSSALLALATTRGDGLLESVPLVSQGVIGFTAPVNTESAVLHFFNPGSSATSGTVTLRNDEGTPLASQTISLDPLASISRSVQELFNTQINGQVTGVFSSAIIAFKSFGTSQTLNISAIQPAPATGTLYVPYFVSGSGYDANLSLINSSPTDTVTLIIQAFDAQGGSLGTGVQATFPPLEQLTANLATLLRLPGGLVTGYVRINLPQLQKGPFTYYPPVLGELQLRTGNASTVIPVGAYSLTEGFILGSGPRVGYYEGLAIVNPNTTAATATLQAINSSGTVVATTTVTTNPGQVVARVTTDLFAIAIPEGSVIRVTASLPLVTTGIDGSLDLDKMRYLPLLR